MLNKFFQPMCWIVGLYFFVAFQWAVGFPPKGILDDGNFVLLALFILFLLLPFAQTLKLGNFFEYSAKIQEVKSDLRDFKNETRELIGLQSTLITKVSQNMSSNVHINIPSASSARQAEKKLATFERSENVNLSSSIQQPDDAVGYFIESGGDNAYALMRLRAELERELRRILRKEVSFEIKGKSRKYFSLMSLWNLFIGQSDDRQNLEPAFRYIIDICNAAVHGQVVPPGHAEEAISMGLRVLEILRKTGSSA